MGNHSVTYTDSRGRQLDIEVDEDASAWVGLRLSENREPVGIVIPADKRETLARALAGWHHGVQPAQPDRPAPVDPSEVRKGDHVEVTYQGWIDEDGWVRSHEDDSALLAPIDSQAHAKTVRILRRAEPEPDPEAVEALADALVGVGVTNANDAPDYARALIRHRGVHVEVPDA